MNGDIRKAVQFMIDTAKDVSHGYAQDRRNGDPDFDCSSLVGTALNMAGYNVSKKSTTRSLEKQLRACGAVDCTKPWRAGDIHLTPNAHVCMSVSENEIAEAKINEKGTVRNGEVGDQTGEEIRVAPFYEYYKGWALHLRLPSVRDNTDTENVMFDIDTIAKKVIRGEYGHGAERRKRLSDEGYDYQTIQKRVNELMGVKKQETTQEKPVSDNAVVLTIAKKVIRGEYGSGAERKRRLTEAGYDYAVIQNKVNELLGSNVRH